MEGAGRSWSCRAVRVVGVALAGLCAAVLLPDGARAQLAWDSPLLIHPHAPHGWSLLLADPYPGSDVAVMAAWRTAAMPVGFGVRFGLGEGVDGDLALFGGADASGELIRRSADVPFDVVWVVGGGASLSDDVLVSLPAGLVAGWSLNADEVVFQPYVGPRVVLDAWIGGRERGEGDDLQLEATVDLGFDLRLTGGWTVRFGATIGDREALAVGIAFPTTGRR